MKPMDAPLLSWLTRLAVAYGAQTTAFRPRP